MRKTMMLILSLALMLSACTPAALAEDTFKIGLYYLEMPQVQTFTQNYPNITFKSDVPPNTTDKLINAFLTGTFDYDIFLLTTSICNLDTVIRKGYLADLTDCEGVSEVIATMRPDVREQITKDGQIYGIPTSLDLSYLSYYPEVFARAGFTEADVPDTFPAFLDLLEKWIAYVESTGDREVCFYANFDESLYNEHSYTRYLTEQLVANTIMQQSYAGESLSFDTPVFRSCLERCQAIGSKLHAVEAKPYGGRRPLVDTNDWGVENLRYFLCLRLDENQPRLISASMHVDVAFADSAHVDMAAAFALNNLQYHLENSSKTALLFSDPQPVENPEYAPRIAREQARLDAAIEQLNSASNASAQKKAKLLEEVERYQRQLEAVSDPSNAYLLSESDLAVFRDFEGHFYFEAPSVFAVGTEYGEMLERLMDRYATGAISAEQFVQQLEEIAWMLEMEVE